MLRGEKNSTHLVPHLCDDILLVDITVQRQDHLTVGKDRSKVGSEDRQFLNELGEKHKSFIFYDQDQRSPMRETQSTWSLEQAVTFC